MAEKRFPQISSIHRVAGGRALLAWAVSAAFSLAFSQGAGARDSDERDLELNALSARPDMVSGGDVLVRISLPRNLRANEVTVTLNGADVTSVFKSESDGRTLVGLVEGLKPGRNSLRAKGGGHSEILKLTNYPITGPIFSGPHEKPYVCETVQANLGPALDENCSVTTRFDYFYRAKNATTGALSFKPLPDKTQYPADLVQTTVYGGASVPYIVRVESGTINRAVYRIALLDDPVKPQSGTWKPGPGWNGKLRYSFGGGCGFGHHQGSNQATAVLDDINLSRGFAFATSTLNVYGTACNDVLSAETAMMVKEHFSERYGVPRYTMGIGGSGGAMQQNLIAQNYPGILDGIVPGVLFPDGQTLVHTPTDCHLLVNYFGSNFGWTEGQQVAVSGFGVRGSCTNPATNWGAFHNGGTSSIYAKNCGSTFPAALVYDPVTNPHGLRCTMFEGMANLYGTDPATGFARRALDNVGIQYGLNALNSGQISVDQFLDLNQKIGGFDIDGNIIVDRTEADLIATARGYKYGRVFNGKDVSLPIIDNRNYRDAGRGDVHTDWHSLEFRQRLIDANGHARNQVIWQTPPTPSSVQTTVNALITDVMDQWLENILNDTSGAGYAAKVLRNKPATAVDSCWDTSGSRITTPVTFDNSGPCGALYPHFGNARTAAGSPIDEDRVKCKTKPVDLADYKVVLTPGQQAGLRSIFPTGVCDYSKKGVAQMPLSGNWISFGPASSERDDDEEDHHGHQD
jgi:hypothetical protein